MSTSKQLLAILGMALSACLSACSQSGQQPAAFATAARVTASVAADMAFALQDARLAGAHGFICRDDGSCLVADTYRGTGGIYRIGPDQAITSIALDRPLRGPTGMRMAPNGELLVAELNSGTIVRVGTDGHTTSVAQGFAGPWNLELLADGSMLVACDNGDIWRVQGGNRRRLYAAPGQHPFAVVADARNNIFVSLQGHNVPGEAGGKVIKLDLQGNASDYAEGFQVPEGLALDKDGLLYVADTQAGGIYVIPQAGTRTLVQQGLSGPINLAWRGRQLLAFLAPGEITTVRR